MHLFGSFKMSMSADIKTIIKDGNNSFIYMCENYTYDHLATLSINALFGDFCKKVFRKESSRKNRWKKKEISINHEVVILWLNNGNIVTINTSEFARIELR